MLCFVTDYLHTTNRERVLFFFKSEDVLNMSYLCLFSVKYFHFLGNLAYKVMSLSIQMTFENHANLDQNKKYCKPHLKSHV